ncbi:hypothetical protein Y032_0104g3609 [Ancylostoma ceylanicum]|uniref:SH2 domain-containing protein n=2 Tax=Ancylostoma ceylanicum TaxID=53326 RepID=A0A016TGG5_9BILA|nr:hypothetical protein Y032_0104g3609 [Ancylostoma ceylanicum]
MDGVRTREREIVATPHMPWFHSNVSREATERMLHQRADGTFLVRESTNFPGDYTLSMAYRGKQLFEVNTTVSELAEGSLLLQLSEMGLILVSHD